MDSGKKTILIVGINNLIGFHLSLHLSSKFNVFGTYSKKLNQYNYLEKFRFKVLRKNSVKLIKYLSPVDSLVKTVKKLRPDALIFNTFISKDWNNKKFKYDQIKNILFHELDETMIFLKKLGCQTIIVTGSSEDFKDRDIKISEEFSEPPENPYGKLKNLLAKTISSLSQKNNLNFAYLRLFSPYGSLDKKHKVTEQLISQKNIKIKNPNFNRNFTYVKDIAKSYEYVINYLQNKNNQSLIVNVSSNKKISIKYFINAFVKILNIKTIINFSTDLVDDQYYYGNPVLKNKRKFLNFKFHSIENSLKDFDNDIKKKYRKFYNE